MKIFIKLHNANDNSPVIISAEEITYIDSQIYEDRKVSEVKLKDPDVDTFLVNETPERIKELIKKETKELISLYNTKSPSGMITD